MGNMALTHYAGGDTSLRWRPHHTCLCNFRQGRPAGTLSAGTHPLSRCGRYIHLFCLRGDRTQGIGVTKEERSRKCSGKHYHNTRTRRPSAGARRYQGTSPGSGGHAGRPRLGQWCATLHHSFGLTISEDQFCHLLRHSYNARHCERFLCHL